MPTMSLPPSRKGDPVTVKLINEIKASLFALIVGEKGVTVRNIGGKLSIGIRVPYVRGGRGGTGTWIPYDGT